MTASTLHLLDTNVISHAMRDPKGAVAQRVFAAETLGANDTLIAAHTHALALGATLDSGDAEFVRVPGLQVENWLHPMQAGRGLFKGIDSSVQMTMKRWRHDDSQKPGRAPPALRRE